MELKHDVGSPSTVGEQQSEVCVHELPALHGGWYTQTENPADEASHVLGGSPHSEAVAQRLVQYPVLPSGPSSAMQMPSAQSALPVHSS